MINESPLKVGKFGLPQIFKDLLVICRSAKWNFFNKKTFRFLSTPTKCVCQQTFGLISTNINGVLMKASQSLAHSQNFNVIQFSVKKTKLFLTPPPAVLGGVRVFVVCVCVHTQCN